MKIIITAGGTSEKIDNVRKITNSSSGKLGMIIANELLNTHDEEIEIIYYICSKGSLRPDNNKVKIIEIDGTLNLKEKTEYLLTTENINYFIHSMAVSDYMVNYVTTSTLLKDYILKNNINNLEDGIKNNTNILEANKISSYEDNLIITLKPTPKIISLIKKLSPETHLIGFKLLDGASDEKLISAANKLLIKNDCDLVIANDLENIRKGIHKAFIIDKLNNKIQAIGKEEIASILVEGMFKND